MILRRKRLPVHLEGSFRAFREVLAEVEQAKGAVTDVMPTTRLPGRPLPDALVEFEAHLSRADDRMAAWRAAVLESEWDDCRVAIADALGRADRLRRAAPDLPGFEGLIAMVEDLIAPLEAFDPAARRFRGLRDRT
jgi:hypothetical protein